MGSDLLSISIISILVIIAGACLFRIKNLMKRNALLQDQLQQSENALIKSTAIVDELSQSRTSLMAKVSHELRSPLNAIIGFAELLYHSKVGEISSQQKEYLSDILSSARHLLLLINDVLDIAKVEAGRMEFYPEQVDLEKILNETKEIFKSLIEKKKLQLVTNVDASLKQIKIDPTRFKQVLYNYVSNALKYTPDGGSVTVRIIPIVNTSQLRLEVEDTGVGVRSEDLNKLFVEFQQLDREIAKQYPSTGLGLALTKHIVEAQGGQVDVNSTFGKGSTFIATLPYGK